MVDPFRRGGFGSPSLTGPFQTGGGNFGQYMIGDTGSDIAYLDKLRAQTAWANGQLTDEAYLAALQKYVNSTDPNSSARISAQNELDDATWSIGRNKHVRAVNRATTPGGRIRELLSLAAYDRKRLATMQKGNEQYREQQDRIESTLAEVRATRWNRIYEQYQQGKLTTEQILAKARTFARNTRGKQDHDSYRGLVRQFDDRLLSENIADATAAWQDDPSKANAEAADKLFAELVSRSKPGTPAHKDAVRARENFSENVSAYRKQLELTRMQSKYERGAISDRDWLDFLRERMQGEQPGTPERIRARDAFLQAGAAFTQNSIIAGIEDGSRTTGDLIDFLNSQLFFMDPNSQQAGQLQAQIAELQAQGYEALNIAQGGSLTSGAYSGAVGSGHMVYPADLAPGGTPVNRKGFASQFDGSQFANTNCGMASAAMLAWAVSGGDTKVSGGDMRYYSGDREGGTWTDDVVRSLDAVGIQGKAYHNMSYAQFKKKVKNGKPAVLTGTSGMLPSELQIGGYTGAHSVYVDRVKEHNGQTWYFVMDPLGRSGYKGQWWTEEALYAFSWKGTAQGTQGSAVFAGKGGNAKSRMPKDTPPPKQAYDTDWKGEGTQGRGGGTSREEAGPQRDWSKGNATSKRRGEQLTGDEAVAAFLQAVGKVEDRTQNRGETEGTITAADGPSAGDNAFRENRARELLDANGGDPRLAAVEWFTGQRPPADVSSWTKTERWYANLVAKPMGLDKVKRGDIIQPDAPPGPIVDGVQPQPPGTAPDPRNQPREAKKPLGINPTTEELARELLDRLGIPARAQAVQMMSAWIIAENGNKEVDGYNPLNLRTQAETQFPGQIGWLPDGTANFDTLEEGLDATADTLEAVGGSIIAAIRSNDPETFTQSLADAGWSEQPDYGNLVTQAYNTLPNVQRVISNTMPNYHESTVSLAQATIGIPDLNELLDVDPHDPNQMAWLTENVDRAEKAAKGGQGSWLYESPDGTQYQVPTGTGVVRDVLYINFEYEVSRALSSEEGAAAIVKAKQRLDAATGEIDFRSTQRFVEAALIQRDTAVMRGEYGTAWEIEKHVYRQVNTLLGNAADADADINNHNNEWLKEDAQATNWVRGIIDRIEPRSTDPFKQDIFNPTGSEVGQMVRDGLLIPQRDPNGGPDILVANPNEMFVTYDDEGKVVIHNKVLNPDEFAETKVWIPGPNGTGETTTMPAYQAPESGWVPIVFSNGMSAYVQPKPLETSLFDYYNVEYEEPSKTIERTYNPLSSLSVPGAGPQNVVSAQDDLEARVHGSDYAFGEAFVAGITKALMGEEPAGDRVIPNMSYGGAPIFNERVVTVAPDPADGLLVRAGEFKPGSPGHPNIQTFSVPDPTTGQMLTGWSIDGVEWLFKIGESYGEPPALIAKSGTKGKFERQSDGSFALTVNGKPVETEDWGQYLTFYGDDREPSSRAPSDLSGVGGKSQPMVIKVGSPSQDGRPTPIDASFSPLQLYRAGAISPQELKVMSMTQRKLTEQWLDNGGQAEINAAYEAQMAVEKELSGAGSENDWIRTALGVPKHEQLTGPNAMTGYADPNVTNGVAANAGSAQLFLAEEQMAAAQAEKAAAEAAAAEAARKAAAEAALPSSGKGLDPGQFADHPYKTGQGGSTLPPVETKEPKPVEVKTVKSQPPAGGSTYTYGKKTVGGTEVDTVQGNGTSGYR